MQQKKRREMKAKMNEKKIVLYGINIDWHSVQKYDEDKAKYYPIFDGKFDRFLSLEKKKIIMWKKNSTKQITRRFPMPGKM